jgi:site-specific DNA-methyltransferase (cytosine-N4-specific)
MGDPVNEATLLVGDALERLRTLPAGVAQTCVTSPPYWGQRDYGTGAWEGGDPEHEHDRVLSRAGRGGSGSEPKRAAFPRDVPAAACACGARYVDQQLGLEADPDAWAARLVGVFDEVRRVLRPDGTLWLNVGDAYAAGAAGNMPRDHSGDAYRETRGAQGARAARRGGRVPMGLAPKQLLGLPWRLAFALQAAGWWLRADLVWAKPNALPESARDRPSRAHEYLFLLAGRARYYYNADAVREAPRYLEPDAPEEYERLVGKSYHDHGEDLTQGMSQGRAATWRVATNPKGRNLRTVLVVNTQPSTIAHFATFPERLVAPCILAGSRPGDLVLDPFAGTATVGVVALRLGRRFLGVELHPGQAASARARLEEVAPLLAKVSVDPAPERVA